MTIVHQQLTQTLELFKIKNQMPQIRKSLILVFE